MRNEQILLNSWRQAAKTASLEPAVQELPQLPNPSGQLAPPMASRRHVPSNRQNPDEAVSAQNIHMVERPDIRHATLDVAVWRIGRPGRAGQSYYRTKGGKIDPTLGFERRWVVYNGYAEATKVPPSWHGWLHHTVDVAPTEETYMSREWEKPHFRT